MSSRRNNKDFLESIHHEKLKLFSLMSEKMESMVYQQTILINSTIKNLKEIQNFYREQSAENRQFFKEQKEFYEQKEYKHSKGVFRGRVLGFIAAVVISAIGIYNFNNWGGFFNRFSEAVISERKKHYAGQYILFNRLQVMEQNNVYKHILIKRGFGFVVDSVEHLKYAKIKNDPLLDSIYHDLMEEYNFDDRGFYEY